MLFHHNIVLCFKRKYMLIFFCQYHVWRNEKLCLLYTMTTETSPHKWSLYTGLSVCTWQECQHWWIIQIIHLWIIHFKGRLHFTKYIRTKHARFGIKFYELTTADGITLDFLVYCGSFIMMMAMRICQQPIEYQFSLCSHF